MHKVVIYKRLENMTSLCYHMKTLVKTPLRSQ